jgi:SAM-dependent methyltransferase
MNNESDSANDRHPGGDTRFWRDEMVREYELRQGLLSEKKEEVLTNITRIINYFCKLRGITEPKILDVGCGPGTPTTLSAFLMEKVPGSIVTGVDSSDQMVASANAILEHKFGGRFSGFVSDFNAESFWIRGIDTEYDFIVSNGTLHYLSDLRRIPFLKELYARLREKGTMVVCLGNISSVNEIAERAYLPDGIHLLSDERREKTKGLPAVQR